MGRRDSKILPTSLRPLRNRKWNARSLFHRRIDFVLGVRIVLKLLECSHNFGERCGIGVDGGLEFFADFGQARNRFAQL